MNRAEFIKVLPELSKDYKPSEASISQIKNVKLLMMIGPSGAGKTTIINALNVPFVPSHTTRRPRDGEVHGKDSYFIENYQDALEAVRNGEFVQVAIGPTGDLYATKASSYPESGFATMPVVADVIPLFRTIGFSKTISAFITPPSVQVWTQRMEGHVKTTEQRRGRLAEARRSFEFALRDYEIHFILNDDLGEAIDQTEGLMLEHFDRNKEEAARSSARIILDHLIQSKRV